MMLTTKLLSSCWER